MKSAKSFNRCWFLAPFMCAAGTASSGCARRFRHGDEPGRGMRRSPPAIR
jgi:hypothetical protein